MKALIQRVSEATVHVDGKTIAAIGKGMVVLLGISKEDGTQDAERLAERVLIYRIFEDEDGKMNRSLKDIQGNLLVVSQFTLAADVSKGTRPSFSTSADPQKAEELYNLFTNKLKASGLKVETGQFGAKMVVSIYNEGPVTFLLETK